MFRAVTVLVFICALCVPLSSAAQAPVGVPAAIGDISVPVLPETIARAPDGAVTVRAVRLDAPLELDGALDEAVYERVRPASAFIQIEPQPGEPATDQTEVWVMFDGDNVYVAARCFDSDMDIIATELRRDNSTLWFGDDIVAISFDTFLDRQNTVQFMVNPVGGRMDGQVANESQWNGDWNAIWDVAVGRFDGGWTAEFSIPFKSLRYGPGAEQTWGFNMLRPSRSVNEISFLTELPPARGQQAFHMASLSATLVGIEAPPGSRTFEVKPYVTSNATSDVPADLNDVTGDVGIDAKFGLTQGVTADITYNTDFAQVEADEQQINLTRFSLFFPEKREFFLENAGTFSFGGVSLSGFGGGETPTLFYSRRIGLEGGAAVPLRVGGRVTGRVGSFNLGLLTIQADEVPEAGTRSTNFSVVRLKRDVLRRSSIGLLATRRSVDQNGGEPNYAYGIDGTFGFFDSLTINTYWARTKTEGLPGDDVSYRAQLNYNGDRYGLEVERLAVGDNFNPEVGFVRRDDLRRSFGQLRFSPRPSSISSVRQFSWTASINYIESGTGVIESRERVASWQTEFETDDTLTFTYTGSYELLPRPLQISRGVTLPVGGYSFDDVQVSYNLAQQRPVRANLSISRGTFYNGHKTTFRVSGGRVQVGNQFSLEPSYSSNLVELIEGDFTTHLLSSRATYTMTPTMFMSALVQYSSGNETVLTNARLRWEYRPGSELFVVYNEQRDALTPRFPDLLNRALIIKVNRLFRF